MAAAEDESALRPLSGIDDLLAPFYAAEKPAWRWRVGTEAEKFGVHSDGRPADFATDIRAVLDHLETNHGWFPQREWEGGEVISLVRGAANITLEPGAQLELSGAPLDTIHQTCIEFRGHVAELQAIGEALDLRWLGLGFHPLATQTDLPWVPKLRYAVMREYLPTRGSMALDMMRRTCTVQANLDFSDADDAFEKLRIGLRLQAVVTAMFANGPWYEGEASGERSRRALVWRHMDPDRSGVLPELWDGPASYERYVEWALDVPMFLVKRGGELHAAARPEGSGHVTFREFLEHGFAGFRATRADWNNHVNSLFPEARLKNTLEMRGADGQTSATLCALPALWKGLLYEDEARRKAAALASRVTPEGLEAARADIPAQALEATLEGRAVQEWAGELLEIAEGGLQRLGHLDSQGRDERHFLAPIRALLEKGHTPADDVLARAGQNADVAAILAAAAF